MEYPVTLTKDGDAYTVSFPDVPEAHTFGETKDEALTRAVDALWTALEMYVDSKRPFPKASSTSGATVTLPPIVVAKLRLYQEMVDQKVNKAELGRRLNWHGPQVDRLLDMRHNSVIDQLDAALRTLGHKVTLTVSRASHSPTRAVRRPARGRPAARAASARSKEVGRKSARAAKAR